MMTTLEKVRRLEGYVAAESAAVDRVLDMSLDKLLARETGRMREIQARLAGQLAEFEAQYGLDSAEFYARYERGEMGDAVDLIEWSATVDMLANVEKRLALLEQTPES
jgi:hypothetical protein